MSDRPKDRFTTPLRARDITAAALGTLSLLSVRAAVEPLPIPKAPGQPILILGPHSFLPPGGLSNVQAACFRIDPRRVGPYVLLMGFPHQPYTVLVLFFSC